MTFRLLTVIIWMAVLCHIVYAATAGANRTLPWASAENHSARVARATSRQPAVFWINDCEVRTVGNRRHLIPEMIVTVDTARQSTVRPGPPWRHPLTWRPRQLLL